MRPVEIGYRFRRTVVALDGSVESRGALERAAEVAGWLETDFSGVFFEDEDLLALSALPFSREVSLGGRSRALDAVALEGELRAQARRARRAIEDLARLRRISCGFEVVRGRLQNMLLAQAQQADLLMLPRSSEPMTRSTGLARLAADVAASATASVLVFDPRKPPGPGPVVTLVDEPENAARTLAVAKDLCRHMRRPLRVLVTAGDAEALASNAEALQAALTADPATRADIRPVETTGKDALLEALADPSGALVVASADTLGAAGIVSLIRRSRAPVLILRARPQG
ncbi:MAG: universal stress protein [Acetobacterales bacterium]